MNDRSVCSFSLPTFLMTRVRDLKTTLHNDGDLAEKLLPRDVVAPLKPAVNLDKLSLTAEDYEELRAFLHSTKKDYDLINEGMINKATRYGTQQIVRKAQTRNRSRRDKQAHDNRAVINISRVVEALLLKGLASVDASIKIAGSKKGNASKAVR